MLPYAQMVVVIHISPLQCLHSSLAMWGVGMHLYTQVHGGPLRWEESGTCTSALNVYAGGSVRQGVENVIVTGLFRSCWLTLWRCWFVAVQDS